MFSVLAKAVFFVPGVGTVQELKRDVVILVEPLHDERLEPGRVLRDLALVRRHRGHVRLVQPFHPALHSKILTSALESVLPEVAVEVCGGLAESMLLVLL